MPKVAGVDGRGAADEAAAAEGDVVLGVALQQAVDDRVAQEELLVRIAGAVVDDLPWKVEKRQLGDCKLPMIEQNVATNDGPLQLVPEKARCPTRHGRMNRLP